MLRFAIYMLFVGGAWMSLEFGKNSVDHVVSWEQANNEEAREAREERLREQQREMDLGLQAMLATPAEESVPLRNISSVED